ncbi:sh3 domain-containing [Anaeramoeba flamelloides]|uniref:Sh3 domain-containing n=1 Tax=Anaeramoeba flamelloides TaxID=1746091 RepID=A0AAV7ZII3_9EUKA|nr:sh3 domain-containing [Anaeramoeba flamelloides]
MAEIAQTAFKVFMTLYTTLQTAKKNKKTCSRLLSRLDAYNGPFERITNNPKLAEENIKTLENIIIIQKKMKTFIEKKVLKRRILTTIKSKSVESDFQQLEKELNSAIADITFELVTIIEETTQEIQEIGIENGMSLNRIEDNIGQMIKQQNKEKDDINEKLNQLLNSKDSEKRKIVTLDPTDVSLEYLQYLYGIGYNAAEVLHETFDSDHDTVVSVLDLQKGIQILKDGLIEEKANFLFNSWDSDGSGGISSEEMYDIIYGIFVLINSYSLCKFTKKAIFEEMENADPQVKFQFDRNFNNLVLKSLKEINVDKLIESIYTSTTTNQDNEIELEEFIKYSKTENNVVSKFIKAFSQILEEFTEQLEEKNEKEDNTESKTITSIKRELPQLSQSINEPYIAISDYLGQEGDLSFVAGQIIVVTRKGQDGWWTGKISNKIGKFPSNYVKKHTVLETKNTLGQEQQEGKLFTNKIYHIEGSYNNEDPMTIVVTNKGWMKHCKKSTLDKSEFILMETGKKNRFIVKPAKGKWSASEMSFRKITYSVGLYRNPGTFWEFYHDEGDWYYIMCSNGKGQGKWLSRNIHNWCYLYKSKKDASRYRFDLKK